MTENIFNELYAQCRWSAVTPTDKYLSFTDYATYMEWIRLWKLTYKALSITIRNEKAQYRQAQHDNRWTDVWGLGASLYQHRNRATSMLDLRHAGKVKSWQLKQAAKATV